MFGVVRSRVVQQAFHQLRVPVQQQNLQARILRNTAFNRNVAPAVTSLCWQQSNRYMSFCTSSLRRAMGSSAKPQTHEFQTAEIIKNVARSEERAASGAPRTSAVKKGEELSAAARNAENQVQESSLCSQVADKGLVFEFSISWILVAYKEIGIGLIRNGFYTFRPVIIFFVMGYVVKFLFFLMGAPMLISFYSVWLFEVGYNLAQCLLSVIFLTQLAYMDMSFRGRLRPMLRLAKSRAQGMWSKMIGK